MSTLERQHILGTGGSAVLGGAVAGGLGFLIAGPPGLAVGAVAGTAAGALIGHRLVAAAAPRGDIGHFKEIYTSTSYYAEDMEWRDYEPAYRFGIATFRTRGGQSLEQIEPQLGARWLQERGESRLSWEQARHAVEHVWRDMAQTLRSNARG